MYYYMFRDIYLIYYSTLIEKQIKIGTENAHASVTPNWNIVVFIYLNN